MATTTGAAAGAFALWKINSLLFLLCGMAFLSLHSTEIELVVVVVVVTLF